MPHATDRGDARAALAQPTAEAEAEVPGGGIERGLQAALADIDGLQPLVISG
jgi:hypothetical protein